MEEFISSPNAVRLDVATRLAVDRTRLAHERTLMAWVRTATSLISFGFTIYKFFQFEQGRPPDAGSLIRGAWIRALMIATGLVALLLSDALPDAVQLVLDKPFTEDFDAMVKRRAIRVAVTFNRTHYFIDEGQKRGITYKS